MQIDISEFADCDKDYISTVRNEIERIQKSYE